jgi:hypothetical protein
MDMAVSECAIRKEENEDREDTEDTIEDSEVEEDISSPLINLDCSGNYNYRN